MRDFNEADKKKKSGRIQLGENPANLSPGALLQLKEKVKESLQGGYLSCPTAWKIAGEEKVPRIALGPVADSLGVRVTNCQIDCFSVDKTITTGSDSGKIDSELMTRLEKLERNGELTCAVIFELSSQQGLAPMDVANVVNQRKWKIRQCQLGCF